MPPGVEINIYIREDIPMNKITKLGCAVFAAALIIACAGCSGSTSGTASSAPASSAPASSAAAESTEESKAESTEESAEESAAESAEESKSDEGGASSENIADYLYFDNSETKWEKVYAYWWNDDYALITNKLTGDPYPANTEDGKQDLGTSWPGVEMEKIGDTDIYRVIMPVGATSIIFNTGVSDDDVKKGVEAYQTADMKFDESANAGQVYKIDLSQEAKKGRGVEKTKFRYPGGGWTDYTA